MITGSIVSPSWSFSSRRHLFKNKDSNYSEHLPNNLRHNTYIEPFSLSLNTLCFATLSMNAIIKVYHSSVLTEYLFFYLFVCLPLLTQSRHNSHLLYLLPYHFYHQSINIILWLNMLYQKKKKSK